MPISPELSSGLHRPVNAVLKWFVLFAGISVWPAIADTTELLMVEEAGCVYCAKFNREIAVAYPKTTEGKTAPLRRIDLYGTWPAALNHIERPRFTPTFILLHDNREIGRLVGYNGDEYFWFLLGELLEKIDPSEIKSQPASSATVESES